MVAFELAMNPQPRTGSVGLNTPNERVNRFLSGTPMLCIGGLFSEKFSRMTWGLFPTLASWWNVVCDIPPLPGEDR